MLNISITTECEGQMGIYLAWGHYVWTECCKVHASSPRAIWLSGKYLFSLPAWPHSVKYFTKWPFCELLHLWGVLTFLQYIQSKLATEVVPHRTVCQDSKICCQNVCFHHSFWRNKILQQYNSLNIYILPINVKYITWRLKLLKLCFWSLWWWSNRSKTFRLIILTAFYLKSVIF